MNLNSMHINISPSQIIAGFIFGVVGLYLFRAGKRDANFTFLLIGVALMAYPYFVSQTIAVWAIGFGLTALAWKLR